MAIPNEKTTLDAAPGFYQRNSRGISDCGVWIGRAPSGFPSDGLSRLSETSDFDRGPRQSTPGFHCCKSQQPMSNEYRLRPHPTLFQATDLAVSSETPLPSNSKLDIRNSTFETLNPPQANASRPVLYPPPIFQFSIPTFQSPNARHTAPFPIRHSPFDTSHSTLPFRHSPFDIPNSHCPYSSSSSSAGSARPVISMLMRQRRAAAFSS